MKNVNRFGQGASKSRDDAPSRHTHPDEEQESCPSPVPGVALEKLCKGNLLEEKVPGYQIVSFFGGWRPCGLIFDQIHTNKKPDAPGAEGDISESRPEGPRALPLPCAWVSVKPHWKVHQGLYLCLLETESQELVVVEVVVCV